MKQTDKKSSTNNQNQTKRPARSESRENKVQSSKTLEMTDQESTDKEQKLTTSLEKVSNDGREESDSETVTDSVSSSGDSRAAEDEKVEIVSRAPQRASKKDPSDSSTRAQRVKSECKLRNSQTNTSSNITKKTTKSLKKPSNGIAKQSADKNSKGIKIHPKLSPTASVTSEGVDDQIPKEPKEVGILDDVSNGAQSFQSDDETADVNENIEDEAKRDLDIKIGEMEIRLDKLEEELREVAALEISLYSIVPEHGSSAHKVHTPARRLSRLYIHAGHHFSHGKRATIAKNTTSGLILIAKSCGNDVSRLTFWWSNTVVLREIITQAFSSSCQSSLPKRVSNLNGASKQSNKPDFMEFIDDWQETRTFASALEKVESWIFSRIIESIWWQTLTPKMQSLAADTNTNKTIGKLLGPALGDQQQGNFSINLWRIAFHDAFKRLCPVRAGGHECGCLPVLSRMVMEHCVARLDVAMFNAILRESAHEMPTDPVSDPIVESRVLPIPAGDLSFGSGAQLKNAVGNWSRWLTDWFGMDTDDDHIAGEENDLENGELKCFHLLNALSDLLMLPKDMLMDRSVRTEVCPSISLPLLRRILCNFTPDEFCPDPVPGAVLEAVNAEYIVERRLSGDNSSSFPYAAAQVTYKPPSSIDIAQKVSETGSKSELSRSASIIQRKGYTSDEELQELDSPLSSIIDKLPSSPSVNERYELLREVWLS